jgi:hypothetical protein
VRIDDRRRRTRGVVFRLEGPAGSVLCQSGDLGAGQVRRRDFASCDAGSIGGTMRRP